MGVEKASLFEAEVRIEGVMTHTLILAAGIDDAMRTIEEHGAECVTIRKERLGAALMLVSARVL